MILQNFRENLNLEIIFLSDLGLFLQDLILETSAKLLKKISLYHSSNSRLSFLTDSFWGILRISCVGPKLSLQK